MPELNYHLQYRRLHQFSDAYYENMSRSYRRFFKGLLPPDKAAAILDIGCGTGFFVNALVKAGYINASGFDSDRSQVEIAQQRQLPVQHVGTDRTAEFLADRRGSLDAVFLLDVLEHVEKRRQIEFLRQIRAALKPRGRLICQVPNALWVVANFNLYMDWTHHCLFSPESLSFVLENAGVVVETVARGHDTPSPPRGKLLAYAMPPLRALLQAAVGLCWRVAVVASLGLQRGLTHPIGTNLIAVAHPQGSAQ